MSTAGNEIGRRIARDLLDVGAVIVRPNEPFTWASGIQAPIYCDNRITLSMPGVRRRITDALEAVIRACRLNPDAIAGVATAGIPQAALLAERLDLPLVYVRGEAKRHGRESRIEGRLEKGARLIVVEDLISTGGSSLRAVGALQDAGGVVTAVLATFSYGLPASEKAFADAGVELKVLATLDDLLKEAELTEKDVEAVREWRKEVVSAPVK